MHTSSTDTISAERHLRDILLRLENAYPANRRGPFIDFSTPLELVVGTVLSAQCTDERVNRVTKNLFKRYRTAQDYAQADLTTLEQEVYQTGFYKAKARYVKGIGELLVREYNGTVPQALEDLLRLPGVARKTAYLILAKAFGIHCGVAVDTHVLRLAPRLGLTPATKDATRVSKILTEICPPEKDLLLNELFITHGRAVCTPRAPLCSTCPLNDICPSAGKIAGAR